MSRAPVTRLFPGEGDVVRTTTVDKTGTFSSKYLAMSGKVDLSQATHISIYATNGTPPTSRWPQRPSEHDGIEQSCPVHPDGQLQLSGPLQVPPFSHTNEQTAETARMAWFPASATYKKTWWVWCVGRGGVLCGRKPLPVHLPYMMSRI